MNEASTKRRPRGGRAARMAARAELSAQKPVVPGMTGGRYRPLSDSAIQRIHTSALDILESVGFADPLPSCVELVTAAGGRLNDAGRLCFPRSLVEDVLAKACRRFTLHGLDPERSLDIGDDRVHFGTAGAAVEILDLETREFRPTTLLDLYDTTRLIDTLDNVHLALRTLICRDMEEPQDLDINTAYALLAGTTKPFGQGFALPESVPRIATMFDMALGGEGKFRQQPFFLAANCFVVPPLRFAEDNCLCLEAQVRAGMPVILISAGQAGATAPAALAGAVVQAVAECLAGLVYVNLIAPGHPVLFGTWPFISDLRTGAMCGGSGEQAVLMAACTQMGLFYDLPSSIGAGMTDSKIPDAQSGFEKGYTTALAAQAGANMINESAGMHASLLGVSLESLVIDNEMLGNVLRTVRGVEVTDETLSVDTIGEVAAGPSHYLGHPQTLGLMEKDYVYPELSDRSTPDQWREAGATDIVARAREKVRRVLAEHYPGHLDGETDSRIRDAFDICLDPGDMKPGGRW